MSRFSVQYHVSTSKIQCCRNKEITVQDTHTQTVQTCSKSIKNSLSITKLTVNYKNSQTVTSKIVKCKVQAIDSLQAAYTSSL